MSANETRLHQTLKSTVFTPDGSREVCELRACCSGSNLGAGPGLDIARQIC